jgi:hypothetical protein
LQEVAHSSEAIGFIGNRVSGVSKPQILKPLAQTWFVRLMAISITVLMLRLGFTKK